jgi:hypothetical protein
MIISKTIIPQDQKVSLHIPESFIGRRIMISVRPVEELTDKKNLSKKKPSDFRGKLNLTDEQYNDFQRSIKR